MAYFLKFLFVFLVCRGKVFSSSSGIIPHMTYEDSISHEQYALLESHFQNLRENPKGNELVEKISTFLSPQQHFLIRSRDAGHAFLAPPGDDLTLCIEINFEKIPSNGRVLVGGIGSKVDHVGTITGNFYEIGSMTYPFYLVLGHELIHALHFLEDKNEYVACLKYFDVNLWGLNTTLDRTKFLWTNFEEQRTVIGVPRADLMDGFCELTLLLAANHRPRYAYHLPDRHFYEESQMIKKYFFDLSTDPDLSGLICENWSFDPSAALESTYNPESIIGILSRKSSLISIEDEPTEAMRMRKESISRNLSQKRVNKDPLFNSKR